MDTIIDQWDEDGHNQRWMRWGWTQSEINELRMDTIIDQWDEDGHNHRSMSWGWTQS